MKKVLSMVLVIALMLGMTSMLSGCKKVKGGTEAAKLLLANERLDAEILSHDIDLGLGGFLNTSYTENEISLPTYYADRGNRSTKYTWSDFAIDNSVASQFESFVLNTQNYAAHASKDIDNMKNRVGIVDKWVQVGFEKHMLRVFESCDMLLVTGGGDQDDVIYRYTDENANNVYEMYSFIDYDDGTSGKGKFLCIPGERYETYNINSEGMCDYFIMENTRGYWMITRFGYATRESGVIDASFTTMIIKDGLGCAAFVTLSNERTEALTPNQPNSMMFTVVDMENGCELITAMMSGDRYSFDVPLSAIASGLVSVGGDEAHIGEEGITDSGMINVINTVKGSYGSDYSSEDDIRFSNGFVQYDYLTETYGGELNFRTDMDTEDVSLRSALTRLVDHLGDMGLTLRGNVETMASGIEHASLVGKEFGSIFEWNGYKLSSVENFMAANNALLEQIDKAKADFDEAKDFETAFIRQRLDDGVHFENLGILDVAANEYSDGVITIGNISTQVLGNTLLESGKEYTLKIALALCDENGNPSSVNVVPLAGGNAVKTKYNGDAITLSVSGSFAVPKNLHEGDYALVVYGAGADSGIRVTEMVKIGSFSTYNEKLESAAMDINVLSVDGNLHVKYVIKNFHNMTVSATKDSYTAKELERIAIREILQYGAPFTGAVLEYRNGEQIPDGAELGRGEYRMMCYLKTSDGLAQSYIYLEVK